MLTLPIILSCVSLCISLTSLLFSFHYAKAITTVLLRPKFLLKQEEKVCEIYVENYTDYPVKDFELKLELPINSETSSELSLDEKDFLLPVEGRTESLFIPIGSVTGTRMSYECKSVFFGTRVFVYGILLEKKGTVYFKNVTYKVSNMLFSLFK